MFEFPWLRGWTLIDVLGFIGTLALVYGLSNLSFGGRKKDAHWKSRGQIEREDPSNS